MSLLSALYLPYDKVGIRSRFKAHEMINLIEKTVSLFLTIYRYCPPSLAWHYYTRITTIFARENFSMISISISFIKPQWSGIQTRRYSFVSEIVDILWISNVYKLREFVFVMRVMDDLLSEKATNLLISFDVARRTACPMAKSLVKCEEGSSKTLSFASSFT